MKNSIWRGTAALIVLTMVPATAAGARGRQSPLLVDLLSCRGERDDSKRLACFDAATARLAAADKRSEVVVVDKETARIAKREAFGLPKQPSFPGLAKSDGELSELLSTIKGAYTNAFGKFIIVLDDGSRWEQTDQRPLGQEPRAGLPVLVRKGTLGSFLMRIANQPAIRVQRTQ